jgi:hypothetical protein
MHFGEVANLLENVIRIMQAINFWLIKFFINTLFLRYDVHSDIIYKVSTLLSLY